MEEEQKIWGYSAVLDETMGDWVDCVILLYMKPFGGENLLESLRRVGTRKTSEFPVRLRDVFLTDGEYDAVMTFSAPTLIVARRFYEYLRSEYGDFIMEKPTMLEVNFAIKRVGKTNPNIHQLVSSDDENPGG
jgi:uncharacterized protein with GYD domain